jgi:hypothetical protein
MLKVERFVDGEFVTLALSGRIEERDLTSLEALIEAEHGRLVLDLKELTLVGREVVNFLKRCEEIGITIRGCPPYIRRWIAKERGEK